MESCAAHHQRTAPDNTAVTNRDCGDTARCWYHPERKVVYGTVYEKGKTS